MSKKLYTGVNNIARNVSKFYVGVNGVARKVKKAYVGVNGVARLFWDGGAQVIPDSWDWWTTVSGRISHLGVNKTNRKIAYYAAVKYNNGIYALLVSTNANAVAYDNYTSQGSVSRVNRSWYYNMQGTTSDTTCLLNNAEYLTITDAVNDLIDKILYIPFHEDYQVGQTYRAYYGNGMKCFRKFVGLVLWNYANRNDLVYLNFSDNIDAISNVVGGGGDYFLDVRGDGSTQSSRIEIVRTGITFNNITIASHSASGAYDYYLTDTGFTELGAVAYISRNGIDYYQTPTPITQNSMAIGIGNVSGYFRSSSCGLDL